MNTNSSSSLPSQVIRLEVRGVGHVPSYKNSKMILWSQRRMMTKPANQHWMEATIQSFVSQLRSEFQTRGIGITTGPTALSKIASFLPLDDSRKFIPRYSVSTQLVSKGEEGAVIEITPL